MNKKGGCSYEKDDLFVDHGDNFWVFVSDREKLWILRLQSYGQKDGSNSKAWRTPS